jgi:hypothetical protein
MVAGDTKFPRGHAWVRWNEDNEANLAVVAPPPNGRRSLAGGETERQSSRVYGARHATECNRASYACCEIRGLTRSTQGLTAWLAVAGIAGFHDAGVGEDELNGEATARPGPIPFAPRACRGRRRRWWSRRGSGKALSAARRIGRRS